VKESGYGREGGTEGLEGYTVVKNVSHLTMQDDAGSRMASRKSGFRRSISVAPFA
jgi:hypothetical protein